MNLPVQKFGSVLLISLPCDHLDAANADDFKSSVRRLFKDSAEIVLDLKSLRFLDSAGLAALLTLLRDAVQLDGDIRLCHVGPQVRALLELVRMHQLVQVFETAESGVRSFE
jgi:anti-sigma B factor antagonist